MLNQRQQEAYDAVINSNAPVVVLTGEGGSGKSYTTGEIIKAWPNDRISITATTNRAKDVIARMSQRKANTTQSEMGYVMVRSGYSQVLKQVREPKQPELLIVDELSMLPYKVYQTIMEHVNSPKSIDKVLFLGDDVQLPAIGKGVDIESIPGVHIELTAQMRQEGNDKKLTKYLKKLRKAIRSGSDEAPDLSNIPSIELVESHKEFAKLYKSTTGNKKVVAFRNRVVDKYNTFIHSGADLFNPGDEVIINKPLPLILDGQRIVVAKNGEQVFISEVRRDPELPRYNLTVITAEGHTVPIHQWDRQSELVEHLEQYKKKGKLDEYWIESDQSFQLKHLYACTVHKTQGASYDTVFIDGADIFSAFNSAATKYTTPITFDLFLRLMYVAISRMKTKCYLYVGKLRHYESFKDKS